MELQTILEKALEGVKASMTIIKNAQGRALGNQEIELKEDDTIVTVIDRASVRAALPYLKSTGIPLVSEDGEQSNTIGEYRQFFDPLDGTSPFSAGLITSTVIWGLYDTNLHQVVACIVGEPASGRIWFSTKGNQTKVLWFKTDKSTEDTKLVNVDKKPLSKRSSIFLDKSHGFTRSGRIIFTDKQLGKLFSLVNTMASITIPGSNGLTQAMVANGGDGVVGSISTALGGPWDVCGVLLVLQAGGYAKAFAVRNGILEEKDPLDIESYDCLITANREENLAVLVDSLNQVLE